MLDGGRRVKTYGTVVACFIPPEEVVVLICRYICHFKVLHVKTIIIHKTESYF